MMTAATWPFGTTEMARQIRERDWADTPLGPIEFWPLRLKTIVDIALAASQAMQLAWGPSRSMLYNDAFAAILGDRHPAALGLTIRDAWPELGDALEPLLEQAFAGDAVRSEDLPVATDHGGRPERTWWQFACSPVHDETRAVVGLLNIVVDVTGRVQSEIALRERETPLQQFGAASRDILWIRDAETLQWQYLSPAFEAVYGLSRAGALSGDNYRSWLDLLLPDDRDDVMAKLERVRKGEHVAFEFRIRRPSDGQIRWLRNTDFPMRDGDGKIRRFGGVGHDATELKRVEGALLDREGRLRTLIEGLPQLIWRSRSDGSWTWASPQWTSHTGQTLAESLDWGWLGAVHPDDRAATVTAWAQAMRQGRLDVETRIWHAAERTWRWHQTRSLPVEAAPRSAEARPDDAEWLGTVTDIEDLKRLQGQQQVLVAELQHRTRNLLAVVRNVARRSIAPSPGRDEYDQRLAALGRVQAFLSRSPLYTASLAELVEAELRAAGDGSSKKVLIDGPSVTLPGDHVQAVALALHELATNAVKYGALAQPAAELAVTWTVEDLGAPAVGKRLLLDWRESRVDMPAEPRRAGYGTELITKALPYQLGAQTELEYRSDGVWCRIVLPSGVFNEGQEPRP